MWWFTYKQGRRHESEGEGGGVNALKDGGQYSKNTNIWKSWGAWPHPPTSYGGAAPAYKHCHISLY